MDLFFQGGSGWRRTELFKRRTKAMLGRGGSLFMGLFFSRRLGVARHGAVQAQDQGYVR